MIMILMLIHDLKLEPMPENELPCLNFTLFFMSILAEYWR